VDEFKRNLGKIVDMVRSEHPPPQPNMPQPDGMAIDPDSEHYSAVTKIILVTPPPVNTQQWGAFQASKEPPQELDRDFEV
jgi:isoamyl acetate esterase